MELELLAVVDVLLELVLVLFLELLLLPFEEDILEEALQLFLLLLISLALACYLLLLSFECVYPRLALLVGLDGLVVLPHQAGIGLLQLEYPLMEGLHLGRHLAHELRHCPLAAVGLRLLYIGVLILPFLILMILLFISIILVVLMSDGLTVVDGLAVIEVVILVIALVNVLVNVLVIALVIVFMYVLVVVLLCVAGDHLWLLEFEGVLLRDGRCVVSAGLMLIAISVLIVLIAVGVAVRA